MIIAICFILFMLMLLYRNHYVYENQERFNNAVLSYNLHIIDVVF